METQKEVLTTLVLIISSGGLVFASAIVLASLRPATAKKWWHRVLSIQLVAVSAFTFSAFYNLSISIGQVGLFKEEIVGLYIWYGIAGLVIQPALITYFKRRPLESL